VTTLWQVDAVADYQAFVKPFCELAVRTGKQLVYFRFGKHAPLITEADDAEIHELHPEEGFEKLIAAIHKVVEATGRRGYHVFDCLSDLAVDWCSDRMLGNFFMLTCPYVYDVGGIAYFTVLKNYHSFRAFASIAETTQILLDVYRHKSRLYVHPIKVQQRHSHTMHMLHELDRDALVPVTRSTVITEILTSMPWGGSESARTRLGIWTRAFVQAEEAVDPSHRRECSVEAAREMPGPC